MSVMFAAQKYLVLAAEKLVLVLLVLAPGFTLVSVSYSSHGPVLLLIQVMVRLPVSPSVSAGMMYRVGVVLTSVSPSLGSSPDCVGS